MQMQLADEYSILLWIPFIWHSHELSIGLNMFELSRCTDSYAVVGHVQLWCEKTKHQSDWMMH